MRDRFTSHRSKLLAAAGVVLVVAVGAFAGSSIGGGSAEPAESIDVSRSVAETVYPSELQRVSPRRLGQSKAQAAKKKSTKLFYYFSEEEFTVQPGDSDLREIRCPTKQLPATGGVVSATPGLAITNSSRTSPDPNLPTRGGAWYERVTNLTMVPLSWRVHLTCVGK
jgi:hypothetical protein